MLKSEKYFTKFAESLTFEEDGSGLLRFGDYSRLSSYAAFGMRHGEQEIRRRGDKGEYQNSPCLPFSLSPNAFQ
jgi:hypothetical protein